MAAVLAKSHFEQDSVLEVDASDHAIGAVLRQIQEDQSIHPVYFGLGSSQRRNATRALRITNVSPSWRRAKSLGRAKVSVVTDHAALRWLMNKLDLPAVTHVGERS